MDRLRIGEDTRSASWSEIVRYLVGVAGLAASITILFLGMRAVMDVGGACADGGPFVSAQPCPEGAALLMPLGMFGLFGFGGLAFWIGSRLGGLYSALPMLAWPALFISLGWNFLEYGVSPPASAEFVSDGPEWGFVIPGVVFVVMGAAPLWIAWQARASMRSSRRDPNAVSRSLGLPQRAPEPEPRPSYGWRPTPPRPESTGSVPGSRSAASTTAAAAPDSIDAARAGVAAAMGSVVAAAGTAPGSGSAASPSMAGASSAAAAAEPSMVERSLVDELERLASMRKAGDLSLLEYESAKRAMIREYEKRS